MLKQLALAALSLPLLIGSVHASDRTDTAVGGALGGAIGAAIGHDMNGRNGAVLGAAIGGATGAAIGSDYRREPQREVVVHERSRYVYAPPPPPRYYRSRPEYREFHDNPWRHGRGHHYGHHRHHHRHHHGHDD